MSKELKRTYPHKCQRCGLCCKGRGEWCERELKEKGLWEEYLGRTEQEGKKDEI